MKEMSPRVRRGVLAAHLAVSVGWIGALLAYLVFGLAAAGSRDEETIRAAWIAMELSGWTVIVPLSIASLITGIVIGGGTKWGVLRYYWVVISLVMTVGSVVVLLLHMPTVSAKADLARTATRSGLDALGTDLVHPSLGLVVLLVVLTLNVVKPPGMTRYGRRKAAGRLMNGQGA